MENPAVGRINTDWFILNQSSYQDVIRSIINDARNAAGVRTGRDRLLIRVEPGLRDGTSEVQVRHENDGFGLPQGDSLVVVDGFVSHLPEAEAELLSEIGAYIAAKVSEQTVSMVAQEISSGVKSAVTRDADGEPVLELYMDRERAWATVGQALTRTDAEVVDYHEGNGTYDVEIPDSAFTGEEASWLERLFGGGKNHRVVLKITEAESLYRVTVRGADGKILDRELAQDILVLLRELAS